MKNATLGLMCVTLAVTSGSALAVSGGTAAMPVGVETTHYDPNTFWGLIFSSYTVVAEPLAIDGAPAPTGYSLIASLTSSFDSSDDPYDDPVLQVDDVRLAGEIRSMVFAGSDTLVFAYQVSLDPDSQSLTNGYLGDWDGVNITDAGVFDPSQGYGLVRPLALTREDDGLGHSTSLSFGGGLVSTWFYFESDDADTYQTGLANLIGLGSTVADNIDVLIPREGLEPPHMPEPLTLMGVGLGVGAAAWRLRRRRTC